MSEWRRRQPRNTPDLNPIPHPKTEASADDSLNTQHLPPQHALTLSNALTTYRVAFKMGFI